MYIESDSIISPESYNKYEVDGRRSRSAATVKRFTDRGLMTRAKVLERFTETLVEPTLVGRHGEAELSNIKATFQKIRDPQTGHVSKQQFSDFFSSRFDTPFPWLPGALSGLYGIVAWHASFPFPPSDPPAIDQDGFIRAVILLAQGVASRFYYRGYGSSTGDWGPHSGFIVQNRGWDYQDQRRRLFRSLAVPAPAGTAEGNADTLITLPVARFFLYQPRENAPAGASAREEDEDFDDIGQQVVVVAEEDERCVDLQDVLSQCPPEQDPLTMNPPRESYESVLPKLPQQPYYLHEMQIPAAKLANLLRLLAVADPSGSNSQEKEELLRWKENQELAGPNQATYISWQEFDSAICKSQQHLFRSLSSLTSVFKTYLDQ
ncbi:hypothetical protein MMC30_009400 [Trapelia coarctata]|nr:hypothetical protein [Trapelia coarctata]